MGRGGREDVHEQSLQRRALVAPAATACALLVSETAFGALDPGTGVRA